MDLHFVSHFIIITIIFSKFTVDSASLPTNSTTCVPQTCGNGPNITSPFWIPQQQPPSCGSPQFNITCTNHDPIITISNQDYVIKHIFHNNHSFAIASAQASNKSNLCPTPLTNFSLHSTPFSYSDLSIDLFFFYNCSNHYKEETYSINCASSGTNFSSFAVYHPEILGKNNYSIDSCQSLVRVPVQVLSLNVLLNENETYAEVLRKGFVLTWEYSSEQGAHQNWRRKLVIGLGSTLLSFVIIFIIYCILKLLPSNYVASLKHKTEDEKNIETFVMQYGSSSTKRYRYSDIKKMTNSFKVKLGQGGFGQVFKGKLRDGRLVAVKVLNSSKANGQEFINEVASIGRTSHVNIVTLLGFCFECQKRALIYEYMPNGSLEKFIYSQVHSETTKHLGVIKLYEIALGIARGLDYLHRGCNTRILHLDIKPHNILLDEDFCPKIADSRFSSGRTSEMYFPDWIYNRLHKDEFRLDSVTTIEENDYARKMTIVGLWCIQPAPNQRPPIDEVIEMLEGSMEALEVPPKPIFSSPPRSATTISSTLNSMPDTT